MTFRYDSIRAKGAIDEKNGKHWGVEEVVPVKGLEPLSLWGG
jgi:hypothetical protein